MNQLPESRHGLHGTAAGGATSLASVAVAVVATDRAPRAGWRTIASVFKIRIGVLIMITALGGYAIMPSSSAQAWQVVVMALAVLVAAASAGAFNQFVEAEQDRLMSRTRRRAFASGALARSPAWLLIIVGLMLGASALAAWLVNPLSAVFTLSGALTYAGLYTVALKRRTSWNIVIGGLAGSFAVLAGAAAADTSLGAPAWVLAFILFLWTPPHFWSLAIANEAEYRAAGVPMLPVVVGVPRAARIVHASTLALVAASLLPVAFGAGWLVLVGALVGGVHFLRKTHALAQAPSRQRAMAAFFASMVQLSVLLAAVALDAALR